MPTTEKLKQEIADAEKKLAQERSRLQRLENRKSYYEKGDRKKRAHRLITRGAAVESIAPLSKVCLCQLPQQHGKLFRSLHPGGCTGRISLDAHENGNLLCSPA